MEKKENLSFYLSEKNMKAFEVQTSTIQDDRIELTKCLYTVPYEKLNMQIGLPKQTEIEAGQEFLTIIEVDQPRSIISIMFQTTAYDIQFGFFRANDSSQFKLINEGEENELIQHPVSDLEEVFPLQAIESSENMVKVTFIAKEEGFYKILFSNQHSWMRGKTLMYRYVVLKPVNNTQVQVEQV